jgi:hypothetical protein
MLAARVHRLGLKCRIAVLLGEIGIERLGRCVQQVAVEPSDRPVGDDVLVDDVIGPARVATVEQANRPVGIAFAMTKPAAESIAPRDSNAAWLGSSKPAPMAIARSGESISSASRHSTQSCAACAPRAPLRSESEPRLLDHARRGRGDFYGIIRLPESTTSVSAAKGTESRQAASCAPASRVITTRLNSGKGKRG